MNNVYLSEMQNKEIISIDTGESLGKIVDALVNENGEIINFVVENKKFIKRAFKDTSIIITYSNIEKMGKDVILVRV